MLAHELAHVKNRDVLVMTVAATVAGAVAFAARVAFWGSMFNRSDNWIIILLVAVTLPIAALLVQLAISRSREYKADAKGAELCGRPLWLASALGKLDAGVKQYPMDNSHASPSTSSLFIVNPFRGGAIVSLLSTHPPGAGAHQAPGADGEGEGPVPLGGNPFPYPFIFRSRTS